MSIGEFTETLNKWGGQRIPFLFLVDFEMQKPMAFRLDKINGEAIAYDVNGFTNVVKPQLHSSGPVDFEKFPPSFNEYKKKFDRVRSHLAYGDSYLTNLTVRTRLKTQASLREIFLLSKARYKLLYENRFLVFSPETFVRIHNGRIFAYPMKGTIDSGIPDAEKKILADQKEMAEHVTIVDLLRNDLSEVSRNVRVTRFRYAEEIRTLHKNLLQISSEIEGELASDYARHLGDILLKLLPAGSVSGAPKRKTLQIIREAEMEPRNYYTGVMGIFDGNIFDSGVMIRFIENDNGTLYYRSGGGITMQSSAETEYQEAIDKVYVPIH